MTAGQLFSTASYRANDLHGISFLNSDLTGWNLSNQNLTGASFSGGTLTGANFAGATVAGVDFSYSNLTADQLYSTASYGVKCRTASFSSVTS